MDTETPEINALANSPLRVSLDVGVLQNSPRVLFAGPNKYAKVTRKNIIKKYYLEHF